MAPIFLLHSPRDDGVGERIARALLISGYAVRRERESAETDEDTGDSPTIVVWTRAAVEDADLLDRAREALSARSLIPIAIGGARPPAEFAQPEPVDLTGWNGDAEDPRWRFVMDEIAIFAQRDLLSGQTDEADDASVRVDGPPPVADTGDHSEPPGEPPAEAAETPPDEPEVAEPTTAEVADSTEGPTFEVAGELFDDAGIVQGELFAESGVKPTRRARGMAGQRSRGRGVQTPIILFGGLIALFAATIAALLASPIYLSSPEVIVAETQAAQTAEDEVAFLGVLKEAQTPNFIPPDDPETLSVPEPPASLPVAETARNEGSVFAETAADVDDAAAEVLPPTLASENVASEIESDPSLAAAENPGADDIIAASIAEDAQPVDGLADDTLVDEDPALDEFATDRLDALVAAVSIDAELATNADPEIVEEVFFGHYLRDCFDCPDMAALPPGEFMMGADGAEAGRLGTERPQQRIAIAKGFAIATKEITFEQWDACVADGGCRRYSPSDAGWGRGEQPVVNISFEDAESYVAWLSAKTGREYRLPSEAEWEYAARSGASTAFSFGDGVSAEIANFNGGFGYNGPGGRNRGRPISVGSFAPNGFGLYDMHGNVWEWTRDCWSSSHDGVPTNGDARGGNCSERVLKGGAFNTGGWRLRSAHRIAKSARARESDNGFRIVRDLD